MIWERGEGDMGEGGSGRRARYWEGVYDMGEEGVYHMGEEGVFYCIWVRRAAPGRRAGGRRCGTCRSHPAL